MIEPKLLIDTNIIIGLEDFKEISEKFSSLHKKCQQYSIKLYTHEASKRDVARDRDHSRRQVILSKIGKFLILEGIPEPSSQALKEKYGKIRNHNDHVDCLLLHALAEVEAVDFLVTHDRGLHRRAEQIGYGDRVFRVEDSLVWIRDTFEKAPVSLPFIQDKQCHQIDRSDDIFNSLKSDYCGFDHWFLKNCVRTHRYCWTINFNGEIAGIAIRKDEYYNDLIADLPSCKSNFIGSFNKILKICTFKIKDKFRGEKLGEQLIKQVLWWSNKNDYDLVYLSVFPKHRQLIDLLMSFGFQSLGRTQGELFLGKNFGPRMLKDKKALDAFDYHRRYYPSFIADESVRKYLIPIHGEYYKKLFPENVSQRQRGLFDSVSFQSESKIPGNTIRKVYVCRTPTTSIKQGDVLLFFHLKDKASLHSQSCVTVGIVDGFHITSKPDALLKLTAKRSVFNPDELIKLTNNGSKRVKVINFYLAGHINPAVAHKRLQDIGLNGNYQSVRAISYGQFKIIESEMNLDVKTD